LNFSRASENPGNVFALQYIAKSESDFDIFFFLRPVAGAGTVTVDDREISKLDTSADISVADEAMDGRGELRTESGSSSIPGSCNSWETVLH
jgi:hypothetical protein